MSKASLQDFYDNSTPIARISVPPPPAGESVPKGYLIPNEITLLEKITKATQGFFAVREKTVVQIGHFDVKTKRIIPLEKTPPIVDRYGKYFYHSRDEGLVPLPEVRKSNYPEQLVAINPKEVNALVQKTPTFHTGRFAVYNLCLAALCFAAIAFITLLAPHLTLLVLSLKIMGGSIASIGFLAGVKWFFASAKPIIHPTFMAFEKAYEKIPQDYNVNGLYLQYIDGEWHLKSIKNNNFDQVVEIRDSMGLRFSDQPGIIEYCISIEGAIEFHRHNIPMLVQLSDGTYVTPNLSLCKTRESASSSSPSAPLLPKSQ